VAPIIHNILIHTGNDRVVTWQYLRTARELQWLHNLTCSSDLFFFYSTLENHVKELLQTEEVVRSLNIKENHLIFQAETQEWFLDVNCMIYSDGSWEVNGVIDAYKCHLHLEVPFKQGQYLS